MADAGTRTATPSEQDARRVRTVKVLGRIASVLSVLMYVSYIPQIANNLAGNYGSPVQPLVAMVNCVVWTAYGLLERPRDMPIVVANVPGVMLGCITFLTALH